MKIKSLLAVLHQRYNRPVLQLLGGSALLLLLQANAAEVTKDIVINADVVHDSNPGLVKDDKNPVWIYSMAPHFRLGITDEVNRWFLDAAVLVQRHSNENVLVDREDPTLAIGWDRTYESGMYGVRADYAESSARQDELKSTGVFTKIDNTAKSKKLSANWLHTISPGWSVLTEGAYSDVSYSIPGSLQAYNLGNIRSKLTNAYTEKLDVSAQLSYSQLRPKKIFDDTELVGLLMGAAYQVNERFKLDTRAGIYDLSGRQSDTDWEVAVIAEYTLDRTRYIAELRRELAVSGIGGFRKVDSLRVGWLYNMSELDQVGAEYSLSKGKKDREVDLDRLDYQQLGAFYERRLSNYWKTRFFADYREQDIPGVRSHGNTIGVSFTYDTLSF